MYNDYFDVRDRYLEHYGVKGMKWRFTKFTNKIRKGGRDIYEYANRKATYYGGQARRELNKAKRVVRKGMKSFGANASTALGRASQLLKSKSGYYSGKARLGFNKARRLVRTGINNLGSSLQKAGRAAYHNINAKYNPSALTSRYNRSRNISALNKATKAHSNAGGVNKYGTKSYNINYDVKNGRLVETGKTLTSRTNAFGTNDDVARRRGVGNQIKSMSGRFSKKKKSRW